MILPVLAVHVTRSLLPAPASRPHYSHDDTFVLYLGISAFIEAVPNLWVVTPWGSNDPFPGVA